MTYYRIGVDDRNTAYWIGLSGLLCQCSRDKITKNFLMQLEPITHWYNTFGRVNQQGNVTSVDWDSAISNEIFEISKSLIDPNCIIGRGAFKTLDGKISYFNGQDIIGEKEKSFIYIKKKKIEIGIENENMENIDLSDKIELLDLHSRGLTFKTESDLIAALGWSAIAPFCGALPFRPNIMLTGPSGSGKSALVNLLFSPISKPISFSGAETTSAGIRQTIRNDAYPIILEECDVGKEKRNHRDGLLLLARQSTSDDTPIVAKGTQTQLGAINYRMRSCYCIVSIDPSINNTQDENRIYKISLKRASKTQAEKYRNYTKKEIKKILDNKFLNNFRLHVWNKLDQIIKHTSEIKDIIDSELDMTPRMLDLDSILLSAYYIIFKNRKFKKSDIDSFYENIRDREVTDTPEEILNLILDSKIRLDMVDKTIRMVIGECKGLNAAFASSALSVVGISVKGDLVYIGDSVNEIRKISNNHQYHLLLRRHEKAIEKGTQKKIGGINRRCTVFRLCDIFESE